MFQMEISSKMVKNYIISHTIILGRNSLTEMHKRTEMLHLMQNTLQ